MAKLNYNFPTIYRHERKLPESVRISLNTFSRSLEKMYNNIVTAVNSKQNSVSYVSQNAQPTPAEGEMILWKDADATAGNPTHYLVITKNSETVTFASQETV